MGGIFIMLCITLIFIFMCFYYIIFRLIKLFTYLFNILDYVYDRGYLINQIKKVFYEKPVLETVYKVGRIVVIKLLKTKLVYSIKRSGWLRKGNFLERKKIYQTGTVDLVKIEAPVKLISAPRQSKEKKNLIEV